MTVTPRIGRWEVALDGEVVLLGSRCTTCGETLFPERGVCSNCGMRTLHEVRLRGPAQLTSYTIVHQVPPGFTGPVAVGYARLPGDVLVLAPIDAQPEELHSGMALVLHVGVTSVEDDATPIRTYRFRPAGSSGPAHA